MSSTIFHYFPSINAPTLRHHPIILEDDKLEFNGIVKQVTWSTYEWYMHEGEGLIQHGRQMEADNMN